MWNKIVAALAVASSKVLTVISVILGGILFAIGTALSAVGVAGMKLASLVDYLYDIVLKFTADVLRFVMASYLTCLAMVSVLLAVVGVLALGIGSIMMGTDPNAPKDYVSTMMDASLNQVSEYKLSYKQFREVKDVDTYTVDPEVTDGEVVRTKKELVQDQDEKKELELSEEDQEMLDKILEDAPNKLRSFTKDNSEEAIQLIFLARLYKSKKDEAKDPPEDQA